MTVIVEQLHSDWLKFCVLIQSQISISTRGGVFLKRFLDHGNGFLVAQLISEALFHFIFCQINSFSVVCLAAPESIRCAYMQGDVSPHSSVLNDVEEVS